MTDLVTMAGPSVAQQQMLEATVSQRLMDLLGGQLFGSPIKKIAPLGYYKPIADATCKLLIRDERDRPVAVALCSSPHAPNFVQSMIARTQAAQDAVPGLENYFVSPIVQGYLKDLSYGVFRYHTPLSQEKVRWILQRTFMSPHVLQFLTEVVARSQKPISAEDLEQRFIHPLTYFSQLDGVPPELQNDAKQALQRLQNGLWKPRFSY